VGPFVPFAFREEDPGTPGLLLDPHMQDVRAVRLGALCLADQRAVDRGLVITVTVRPDVFAADLCAALSTRQPLLRLLVQVWRGVDSKGRGLWAWSRLQQIQLLTELGRLSHSDSLRETWTAFDLARWLDIYGERSFTSEVLALLATPDTDARAVAQSLLRKLEAQRSDVSVPLAHLVAALPTVLARSLRQCQRYSQVGRASQLREALCRLRQA
jgi:hypothetical protein